MSVKLLINLGKQNPGDTYSGEHEAMLLNEGHAVPVDGDLADYLHVAPSADENTPGDTPDEPSVGSSGHSTVEKKLVAPKAEKPKAVEPVEGDKKSEPAKKASPKKSPEAKR